MGTPQLLGKGSYAIRATEPLPRSWGNNYNNILLAYLILNMYTESINLIHGKDENP